MSVSDSALAKPFITGLLRLPDLNSLSCLARYSGCWPAMIGLAGLPREPSAVWQAPQTWVDNACPLARSGLTGALFSAATTGIANAAANNRAMGDFIRSTLGDGRASKPTNFTMAHGTARPERSCGSPRRPRLGAFGPVSRHGQPPARPAGARVARDRFRRPQQRRQVVGD